MDGDLAWHTGTGAGVETGDVMYTTSFLKNRSWAMKSTFSQHTTPRRHNLTKQPCSLVTTVRSLVNKESQRHSTLALNKH